MSPKRKSTQHERKLRQAAKRRSEDEAIIEDTAAVFTCFYEIARDYADQCEMSRENLEADIAYNQVACEIWRDYPGPRAEQLLAALADHLTEKQRHIEAIRELEARFEALTTPPLHEHLDPVELYQDLIRRRIFPRDPESPSTPTPTSVRALRR
jgi:hypothetical protein